MKKLLILPIVAVIASVTYFGAVRGEEIVEVSQVPIVEEVAAVEPVEQNLEPEMSTIEEKVVEKSVIVDDKVPEVTDPIGEYMRLQRFGDTWDKCGEGRVKLMRPELFSSLDKAIETHNDMVSKRMDWCYYFTHLINLKARQN